MVHARLRRGWPWQGFPLSCGSHRGQVCRGAWPLAVYRRHRTQARSAAGPRDGCPERGFAFEEALAFLLRREFGLAFSLDASPRSCFVLFFYFSGWACVLL